MASSDPWRTTVAHPGEDRSLRAWVLHAGPLLAVAIIPVAALLARPDADRGANAWIALVTTVLLFATWLAAWRLAHAAARRLDPAFAYAFLPIVMLWRDGEGGASSGYGPLVLGPLVFLALHASRRQVIAGVAGMAVVFFGPAYLLDDARYPFEIEARRGAIWVAAGFVSGLAINRLVAIASLALQTTELVLERLPGTVIILVDRDCRYLSVHGQGAGTEDGLPWESLVGRTPKEIFGPRAGRFEQELLLTFEGRNREFEWMSTSGKRTHLVSTSPWSSTGPHDHAAAVIVVRDITERVQAERDLAREQAFLQAVLDNMQDGVSAIDTVGSTPILNDSLRRMLGVDRRPDVAMQDWIGNVFTLYDSAGEPIPTERTPLCRALGGEDIRCEQLTVVTEAGERHELEATAAPIMLYGDAILGSVMTLHDVTAQREAERMKDQFFALVSHELRTPLAAIIGYLELLDEEEHDNLSEDGREFVAVMQRNSRRLMRLIGDLLFAAQVEAGTLALVPAPLDVEQLARDAYDTARVRAAERGQDVHLDLPEGPDADLGYVGDRDRLGQVLDNLLTNAIKFTPEGGRIDLAVRRTDAAIEVDVRDTGRGIPEDEQARLFERFARARSADEDAVQGVGLGLAITKAIVDAHGGRIELESTVGIGTTFRVVLPTTATPDGDRPTQQVRA